MENTRELEREKPKRKLLEFGKTLQKEAFTMIQKKEREKYEKSLDWSKITCKTHPKKKAIIQINPPKGNFFCNECYREMQIQTIRNKGVGWL